MFLFHSQSYDQPSDLPIIPFYFNTTPFPPSSPPEISPPSNDSSIPVLDTTYGPVLRKSSRSLHPPSWVQDYVLPDVSAIHAPSFYLHSSLSFDFSYEAFLNNILTYKEPSSYSQAKLDPIWVNAMQK